MVESEFGALRHGFIRQPALEQVLFEDVAFLCQQFLRSVGENDADALDIKGLDMVGQFQVQVLNRQLGQALAAVDRRADFRIGFQQ